MDPELVTAIRKAHIAAQQARRQRNFEKEASILSRTRKSLGSRRQQGSVAEINNTVFDFKSYLPYRMPALKETVTELPTFFEAKAELLQPATLLETYRTKNAITYYWEKIQSPKSRICYNWTIPQEWGSFEVMLLGHLFRSTLLALIHIWYAQHKMGIPQEHPRILLKEERPGDPLLMNEQSLIFENADLWKLMGGKYKNLNSGELDRILKTLYALNFCRSIFERGKWKGYHYGHIINELIFGSAQNPKLRYVELAGRYLLSPEDIPDKLNDRSYTKVTQMDVALEKRLTPEGLLFCEFSYREGGSYKVNEEHIWRLDHFYERVLHKSASYIASLAKARMLDSHLLTLWGQVNTRVAVEGLLPIPKPYIYPKRKGLETPGQQRVKFFPVWKSPIHS